MSTARPSAAAREDFDRYTYSAFPEAKYDAFLDRYVTPFGQAFERCLDLGCGSGGLMERLQQRTGAQLVGVDISEASIEAARARPSLAGGRSRFQRSDVLELEQSPELLESFDLIVSYSVLHFVPGDTPAKLRLLRSLLRPSGLVAVDALARVPWNRAMFGLVRLLIRTGLWGVAVRGLAPLIGPSFPPAFMEELGRMSYLRHLRYRDFFDVRALATPLFRESFELLRLEVVPQDGFFTGRKARLTLRRLPTP
jgi:SAM-dependent methyltransferase